MLKSYIAFIYDLNGDLADIFAANDMACLTGMVVFGRGLALGETVRYSRQFT